MTAPGCVLRIPPSNFRNNSYEIPHMGIPTAQPRPDEIYLESLRLYVTDPAASPYAIEWLRFEDGSPMPDAVKTNCHVAFEVDDLAGAIAGKTVIVQPFSPAPGLEIAFIVEDGAIVELCRR